MPCAKLGPARLWCPAPPTGRPALEIWGSAFSQRGEDLHLPTLRNHIILMRMQMKGKLWEMALDEFACQKCFTGEGCCEGEGEPSSLVCQVAFSGGLVLGGTWPSLKETHLH